MATSQPSPEPAESRRLIRRVRRGGFSPSSSTEHTTLRAPETSAEPDEVDAAINPVRAVHRIRRGDVPAPPPTPDRENPRARLNEVALAGSASYAKEYRLQLLHRLLMRNVPLDQIAAQLQVSISTVQKDRVELKARLREAATQLNINELIGGQSAVYDEIAGMAMRVASTGARTDENGNAVAAVPTAMRLAAMRTALAANADRTRFLASAGVFDVLRFQRSEDGSALSDVQQLMMRTQELMEQMLRGDADSATPPPKKLEGAFKPMSFDDADASESLREIQEL